MPPPPPYDRAIALACTLPALRHRWLYARCQCGTTHQHPINLTLIQKPQAERWTLADLVVRFRCTDCRGRMASVLLVEDHRLPACSNVTGGPIPGWSLLLHGVVG